VPAENAESALAAYRAGEVDAVTNANFQPLALKLLQPFDKEFHQTIHGALNFYEFNLQEKPFDDVRVREALAISIERELLTEDDMDGVTKPALSFLPFEASDKKLKQDIEKAQKLLAEAGFPGGENFPTIKLVVNRNNIQQRIARSIARMWQKNLNLKTDIIPQDQADYQNSIQTGNFSLARRGVVLPTNNETSNMLTMFHEVKFPAENEENEEKPEKTDNQILTDKTAESNLNFSETEKSSDQTTQNSNSSSAEKTEVEASEIILTEEEALEQLPAIPLYFPISFSLVKPYVQGFELNAFDALSLKNVQIDSNWQPPDPKNGSKN
jgi:oligopeptide transport system substrate-binding protein